MFAVAEHHSLFLGIKVSRHASTISHLMFADDLMVFSRARVVDAETINFCLLTSSQWSGQKISALKSGIFFSVPIPCLLWFMIFAIPWI